MVTIYIKGQKIGSCEYIKEEKCSQTNGYEKKAHFKCECGSLFIASIQKVKSGHTKSCGCRFIKSITKHGLSKSIEYKSWEAIRNRCYNINNEQYKDYGGRGIKMCTEWDVFYVFYKDMGKRPSINHTIERKNNNKGYFKENCIWATKKQQVRNRRNTLFVTYNGETKPLAEWGEVFNMRYDLIFHRVVRAKWPLEKAFNPTILKGGRPFKVKI